MLLQTITALNGWRQVLYQLQLIGRDAKRYGGYSYGNISCRGPSPTDGAGHTSFIISGTQTGHLADTSAEHYTTVLGWDVRNNAVEARGPIAPSSECLTHAMLYALDETINVVMHAHCSAIWRHAAALELPATRANVPYGTPEMADEV